MTDGSTAPPYAANPPAATTALTESPPPPASPQQASTTPTTAVAEDPAVVTPPTAATPPAPVPAPVTANPPAPQVDDNVHPQVRDLQAMFPDFDDVVLQSVLESVSWKQDRAIDLLLGMSDPEYKGDETRPQQEEIRQEPLNQTDLDEQLARRLLLEDQQQEQAAWQAQQVQQGQQGGWRPGPARRASQNVGPEKDTMAELGQQLNKFAETGKKTLGTLFSKVKAKVQEFDQQMQNPPAGSSSTHAGAPPVGGDTYVYDGSTNPFPDPRRQSQPQSPPAVPTNRPPTSASPPPSSAPVQGYDLSTSSDTPPPPSTASGMPIDGGKIGLLPKRPVSLLRASSPTTEDPKQVKKISTEREDELEYAENPFEDGGPSRK